MNDIADWFWSLWGKVLFTLGQAEFSIGLILSVIVALFFVFFISAKLKILLVRKIFPRYKIDIGVSESIATIIRYTIITIGFIIILQSTGIDLSALGLLVGALGIGIGFGLQNITNNFISGIIILFERPVKVGDRIEVNNVTGNIVQIAVRATTIVTNDNISIIVPNSEFVNSVVINWSLENRNVRFNFPVGVAYKEDPQKIRKLLLEVALENKGVLKEPSPDVLFEEFGDSSLVFNLRVWSSEYSDRPKVLKSQLYYSIFEKFKEHGVEIPFPQRDLHVRSGIENLVTHKVAP
jgi:small-conductance mechanosensitive channel